MMKSFGSKYDDRGSGRPANTFSYTGRPTGIVNIITFLVTAEEVPNMCLYANRIELVYSIKVYQCIRKGGRIGELKYISTAERTSSYI